MSFKRPEGDQEHTPTLHIGDFTISLPKQVPAEISAQDFRTRIEKLFQSLTHNQYEPSKLSKPLRSGDIPITTTHDLITALTPSGKYLAENLPDEAKSRTQSLAEQIFAQERNQPLPLHIYPGTINLPLALADLPNNPTLLDHLFHRQVDDIIKPLAKSANTVQPILIDSSPADKWVYEKHLPADQLRVAQLEHTSNQRRLSGLSRVGVEEVFPNIGSELEATLGQLETFLDQTQELSLPFLETRKAKSWSHLLSNLKTPTSDYYSHGQMKQKNFSGRELFLLNEKEFMQEILKQTDRSLLPLLNLATPWEFYMFAVNFQIGMPQSRPEAVKSTGRELPQSSVELAKRILTRELTYNRLYLNNPSFLPRLVPGSANYFKQFLRRFATATTLSGFHQVSIIPEFEIPSIMVADSSGEANLYGYEDAKSEISMKTLVQLNKLEYSIPTSINEHLM